MVPRSSRAQADRQAACIGRSIFLNSNAYQLVTQVTDEPSTVASPIKVSVVRAGRSTDVSKRRWCGHYRSVHSAGMVIASEDSETLDVSRFNGVVRLSFNSSVELPTIIWLSTSRRIAAELVSSVLGGGESTIASAVDTVTGGLGGGMLGLLGMGMGGGGGVERHHRLIDLNLPGSVNIVPDARLNALIIHANPIDMQMIEMILEKIDIQESPEDRNGCKADAHSCDLSGC